jgi:hypothetical protein
MSAAHLARRAPALRTSMTTSTPPARAQPRTRARSGRSPVPSESNSLEPRPGGRGRRSRGRPGDHRCPIAGSQSSHPAQRAARPGVTRWLPRPTRAPASEASARAGVKGATHANIGGTSARPRPAAFPIAPANWTEHTVTSARGSAPDTTGPAAPGFRGAGADRGCGCSAHGRATPAGHRARPTTQKGRERRCRPTCS